MSGASELGKSGVPIVLGKSFFPQEHTESMFYALRYHTFPDYVDSTNLAKLQYDKRSKHLSAIFGNKEDDDVAVQFKGLLKETHDDLECALIYDAVNNRYVLERLAGYSYAMAKSKPVKRCVLDGGDPQPKHSETKSKIKRQKVVQKEAKNEDKSKAKKQTTPSRKSSASKRKSGDDLVDDSEDVDLSDLGLSDADDERIEEGLATPTKPQSQQQLKNAEDEEAVTLDEHDLEAFINNNTQKEQQKVNEVGKSSDENKDEQDEDEADESDDNNDDDDDMDLDNLIDDALEENPSKNEKVQQNNLSESEQQQSDIDLDVVEASENEDNVGEVQGTQMEQKNNDEKVDEEGVDDHNEDDDDDEDDEDGDVDLDLDEKSEEEDNQEEEEQQEESENEMEVDDVFSSFDQQAQNKDIKTSVAQTNKSPSPQDIDRTMSEVSLQTSSKEDVSQQSSGSDKEEGGEKGEGKGADQSALEMEFFGGGEEEEEDDDDDDDSSGEDDSGDEKEKGQEIEEI